MNIENYSFVVSGKFRKNVFMQLESKKSPSQIAKNLNASTTQVSRTLKQLESRNLIGCLTPSSRMGKIYALTDKGKEVFSDIKKDSM